MTPRLQRGSGLAHAWFLLSRYPRKASRRQCRRSSIGNPKTTSEQRSPKLCAIPPLRHRCWTRPASPSRRCAAARVNCHVPFPRSMNVERPQSTKHAVNRWVRPPARGMPCRLDASCLSWRAPCGALNAILYGETKHCLPCAAYRMLPGASEHRKLTVTCSARSESANLRKRPTRRPSRSPLGEAPGAFVILLQATFATLVTGGRRWISSLRVSRNSLSRAIFRGIWWPENWRLETARRRRAMQLAPGTGPRTPGYSTVFEGWLTAQIMSRRRRVR